MLQRNARLFLLSNVLLNISAGAITLLYSIFLIRLGYGTAFQSSLLVVGIAGALIGLLPSISLSNRISIRTLLLWSNLIGGVAAAVQLFIITQISLYITTFILGMSAAIYIVLTPPLLAATSSEQERAHLFSLNSSLGYFTAVIGSLIGGVLPLLTGLPFVLHFPVVTMFRHLLVRDAGLPLQLALILVSLIALPSLIPLAMMDDARIEQGAKNTRTDAMDSAALPMSDHQRPIRKIIVEGIFEIRNTLQQVQVFLHGPFGRFAIYQAFLGLGAGLFLTFINVYFVQHLGVNIASYGIIASISTILLGVATLTAPVLSRIGGPVRVTIIAQFLSLPFLFILAIGQSIPLIIAAYFVRTILMNIGQPVLQSFIMGTLPAQQRSVASSILNVSWQVMLAIGGTISGVAIGSVGFTPVFLGALVCYAIGMVSMLSLFGQEQRFLAATSK